MRLRFPLILTASALVLGGCPAPDDGDSATPPNVTLVDMRGLAFSPKTVTIRVGQTVRWVNRDIVIHTVTSGDADAADTGALFDSGNIFPGGQFERTFDTAGQFEYFCVPHRDIPQMRDAFVIVEP